MPKVGDFWESYRTGEFVLTIDGTESPGVTKVSGLSEGEIDTIEQPDGGSAHVYKIAATKIKYDTLTIERYVDGSPEDKRFKDWFQQTFSLNSPTQGNSGVRKNGMIVKKHNGVPVLSGSDKEIYMSTLSTPAGKRELELTLPVGYSDENGQVHRTVVLRKMTGKEEAILADRRNQRNGGRLVTELLHSCIVRMSDLPQNGTSTVAGMYSADRNYLLIKLRSITFGSELQAGYSCPTCSERLQVVEDLDELPVRSLADGESPDDIVIELEDGYTDRDGQVHTALTMRLPTGADEEAVASQMRQNASLGKNALLARCMKSLGDVPKHRLEAIGPRILADLTMSDRRLIDRALNQSAPGIDLTREIECPNCGHVFKTTLDMTHFLVLE